MSIESNVIEDCERMRDGVSWPDRGGISNSFVLATQKDEKCRIPSFIPFEFSAHGTSYNPLLCYVQSNPNRNFHCLLHSYTKWKKKRNLEDNMYSRKAYTCYPTGYVQCINCAHRVCDVCIEKVIKKMEEKKVKDSNWYKYTKPLLKMKRKEGYYRVLRLPPNLSHCCSLKVSTLSYKIYLCDFLIFYFLFSLKQKI